MTFRDFSRERLRKAFTQSSSLNHPVGLLVVKPGSATGCNGWSYSEVRGTCFSLAVCQLVPYIITWLQVRHLYFSLLKSELRLVLLGVVDCSIENVVIGLRFSLFALK